MILFNHNKQINLDYDDSELIMTDVESGVEIRAVLSNADKLELIRKLADDI